MTNEKLISARKAKKMTQTDIAIYLKISQPQYFKREKGQVKIIDTEWSSIAKLLGVQVEDIYEPFAGQITLHDQLSLEIDSLKEKLKMLEEKD
ncbi:hypothetical protein ASG31_01895 [Chryseobacterium sp. Leaf404]|uniref:helix-turn-helix domain-containing protein n=1 Tax=unclassified Chryseobacterium TaxID=2593645 RepID=UPI0006F1DB7A|nr:MULTISPECIES: helix-turn-helix transcriptional regulator [unclassified Chryseobacterium]KQT22118.1 hypothetical protein ASG31_01895 [Chryseobacterium sp. Leaf404]